VAYDSQTKQLLNICHQWWFNELLSSIKNKIKNKIGNALIISVFLMPDGLLN
jgi:hypothetical protein